MADEKVAGEAGGTAAGASAPANAAGSADAGAAAATEVVEVAAPKVKTRKPKQRACDEKDAKGKLCAGHLKRWYEVTAEVEALVGKGAEVYRCEFCQTVYRPDPQQQPNSFTVRY